MIAPLRSDSVAVSIDLIVRFNAEAPQA